MDYFLRRIIHELNNELDQHEFASKFSMYIAIKTRVKLNDDMRFKLYADMTGELESKIRAIANAEELPTRRILDEMNIKVLMNNKAYKWIDEEKEVEKKKSGVYPHEHPNNKYK